MRRIFVSLHFDPDFREILDAVEAIARGHDIEIAHGVDLDSGGWTDEVVLERIKGAEGFISFITKRPGGRDHSWLASEYTMARGLPTPLRMQIVREEGEQLPGPMQGRSSIAFNRSRPLAAFSELAHRVSTWARSAGRPTWVRLEADELPELLAVHVDAVCRYRFLRMATGEESGWRDASVHKIDGEVRVRLMWPDDDDLVMLRICEDEASLWETSWQHPLVSIRERGH